MVTSSFTPGTPLGFQLFAVIQFVPFPLKPPSQLLGRSQCRGAQR